VKEDIMDAGRRPFSRIGLFVVALAVGFLLARAFPPQVTPQAPGHQFIQVGPQAKEVSGPLNASMSRIARHEATWKSTTGKPLIIFFKKSELPTDLAGKKLPPFQDMDEREDRWEVRMLLNDPSWRFSGQINSNLTLSQDPKKGLEFKYWQDLVGADPQVADGKIIIKW
jgi:hypothetical protein